MCELILCLIVRLFVVSVRIDCVTALLVNLALVIAAYNARSRAKPCMLCFVVPRPVC